MDNKQDKTQTKPEATGEMDKQLANLKVLRDEIRVKLHLAGMDAKTAFTDLEHQAEHLSRDIQNASRHAIDDVTTKLKSLAQSITGAKDEKPAAKA